MIEYITVVLFFSPRGTINKCSTFICYETIILITLNLVKYFLMFSYQCFKVKYDVLYFIERTAAAVVLKKLFAG